jgi:hypothetical protein
VRNRRKPGLPTGFDISIPASTTRDVPVDLGDFLDEEDRLANRPERGPHSDALPARRPPPPSESLNASDSRGTPLAVLEEDEADGSRSVEPLRRGQGAQPARAQVKPKRKQVNMDDRTLEMLDQIVRYVQTFSVQPDAKASEVVAGIVGCLHEALDYVDLRDVPSRGAWGSSQSRAFRSSLRAAFRRGIGQRYNEERR